MTKYNPIGLCIQRQAQDFDPAKCISHVRAAEYITCQVLDDQQLAIDLHIPYAVFRDYNMEPQPGSDPKGVAQQTMAKVREIAARPGGRHILYYINNEPAWSKARNDMYAEMIEISANEPGGAIGLCVGNYGVGTIKSGQGADPNWWDTPDAELLLRTLHKYRDVKLPNGSYAFVLGLDEYTGLFPWIASNGAEKRLNPQWEHRPSVIDMNKDQWHLLRAFQGIWKACKRMGILPPHILIEEAVIDGMDDVIYTFGDKAKEQHNLQLTEPARKPQGWRTLIPQYAIWYPGKDPEDVLADFHIWVWETVYAPFAEYILGMTIYCAWDASGDGKGQPAHKWKWFRVDNAPKYLKRMEGYRWTKVVEPPPIVIPPVDPPPPPPASEPAAYPAKATAKHVGGAAIYADKTFNHEVGRIAQWETVDVETVYDALQNQWRQIKWEGVWRWHNLETLTIEPNEPPLNITAKDTRFAKRRLVALVSDVKIYKQTALGQIYDQRINATGAEFDIIPPELHTPLEMSHLIRKQATKGFIVVRMGNALGFVESDQVVIEQADAPFFIAADDPRFGTERWKCIVDGMNTPVNIRDQPSVNGAQLGQLFATQSAVEVGHIPHEQLTPAEQDGVTDSEGQWHVLKHDSYGVCYVAAKYVRLEKIPAPHETVVITVDHYNELVQAENDLRDLQMRYLTLSIAAQQAATIVNRVGQSFDNVAQILQGSALGDINDAVELLSNIEIKEKLH